MKTIIGIKVRPKGDMSHLKLSRQKEYRVLNVLFGKYQIENDHGFIDYYAPGLFETVTQEPASPSIESYFSPYDIWEGAVIDRIEELCDCTRSDAQGVVEAQAFYMAQSWAKGLSAEETAKLIEEKSKA